MRGAVHSLCIILIWIFRNLFNTFNEIFDTWKFFKINEKKYIFSEFKIAQKWHFSNLIQIGHRDIASLLEESDADIEARNDDNKTPCDLVQKYGKKQKIRFVDFFPH